MRSQPIAEPPRRTDVQLAAWLFAAISGVLQVLIFPLPNWTLLCWIAIAPLLVAMLRARRDAATGNLVPGSVAQCFLLAWLAGIIWCAGSCYWVYYTMHTYGGLDPATSVSMLVLFCLYVGAHLGLFGLLTGLAAGPARLGVKAVMLAPFFWVAMELFRDRLMGFPWDLLGTVLVDNIPLSRIATVTGVYGLSFEIVLVNALFASAFLIRRERRAQLLVASIFLASFLQAGEFFQPPRLPAVGTARLVQSNVPILDQPQWSNAYFDQTLKELSDLSIPKPGELQSGEPIPDLIVWPESPSPFFINEPRFSRAVSDTAVRANAYMVVGSLGLVNAGGTNTKLYNSAALIAPSGRWLARYDKIHLVPFGEYVPFKDLLSFAQKLTREVGDFERGDARDALQLAHYRLGVFICYESIFPNEIRQFAASGGEVFVNISNDGWFGDTGAPFQHLNMARMRAIENYRWLLRDTNTGVTAAIDPYGRIVARAPRHERTVLDAPYSAQFATTFYSRHGDVFAFACAIISLGLLLALIFRHRMAAD